MRWVALWQVVLASLLLIPDSLAQTTSAPQRADQMPRINLRDSPLKFSEKQGSDQSDALTDQQAADLDRTWSRLIADAKAALIGNEAVSLFTTEEWEKDVLSRTVVVQGVAASEGKGLCLHKPIAEVREINGVYMPVIQASVIMDDGSQQSYLPIYIVPIMAETPSRRPGRYLIAPELVSLEGNLYCLPEVKDQQVKVSLERVYGPARRLVVTIRSDPDGALVAIDSWQRRTTTVMRASMDALARARISLGNRILTLDDCDPVPGMMSTTDIEYICKFR